ncbi:hypothetical protein PP304_gp132 [Gordonia phage Phendrix]|uniref:Uncharacterized protein n=1 Tax=Gordonia phage Phendrix TaxID=2593335 RepID=A0A514U0T0_9CAUD|nr:hypothetical protein PP304_gp005 [Gordonia phage Phendrix]YP_010649235.1 hypothetical protein PP304_gp132 [Gordonia phage Phendrix]QDK02553.1 hypothetical protein SEA_PHENDRIX_5 [Gordonia phage Phendrix]QDK02737.1 hypothetical protein SEA_PHENDRIX_221 [Gordonia phage Phendrix]
MATPHLLTIIVPTDEDILTTTTTCESFVHAFNTAQALAGTTSLYVLRDEANNVIAQAKIDEIRGA